MARLDEQRLTGRFGDTMDALGEGITFNIDRPMQGLYSALVGDGYQYGKAVDAYRDEARSQRIGGFGTAAEVAGSVLSPSPISKGNFLRRALMEVLSGGGQAALEGQNLATEGDQRNVGDIAKDFTIGGAVSGALTGLGRLIKPAEVIDAPTSQRQVNETIGRVAGNQGAGRVETAGIDVRDALVREQGDLRRGGQQAMRDAVKGDFTVTGQGMGQDVRNIYQTVGDAPIPITNEGTPTAAAFLSKIDETIAGGDTLSLAQIDQLRIQQRGLRASAANPTDAKAIDNLGRTLDRLVDQKVAGGAFQGDAAYNEAYRNGRTMYEKAMQINDMPAVRRILKDPTIPGAAIADTLLSINTSTKSKAPAKLVSVLTETLGEGSESLENVRRGVIATMFENAGTDPTAQSKLLQTLERNETLIGELFTPDQVSDLAEVRVALSNAIANSGNAQAAAAAERRIKQLLTKAVQGAGTMVRNPVKTGATAGVASGSVGTGLTVAGLLSILNVAASRPTRSAVAATAELGAKPLGRSAAQNETINTMVPNPRDALIDQLGAQ
jgi:hypothetical protein